MYFLEDAPQGERGSEGCRSLANEPHRMVSSSWNAPPKLSLARRHNTWVVVDLDEPEEGVVRVRLTLDGFDEMRRTHPEHAEECSGARAYFDSVWPRVRENLKSNLRNWPVTR